MNCERSQISLLLLLCLSVLALPGQAHTGEPENVAFIKIEGNSRIPTMIILKDIRTKVGAPFSKETLREDVRELYTQGNFSDIRVESEKADGGISLTFVVRELPVIEKIKYEGNCAVKDRHLRNKFSLKPGEIFSGKKLMEGEKELLAFYHKRGFYNADVSSKTAEKDGVICITIFIKEGTAPRVAKIELAGNNSFADKVILKQMKLSRRKFLRKPLFFEELFKEDTERILAFYRNNGFIRADLKTEKIADETGEKLHLKVVIREGTQYKVGKVELKESKELAEKLELKSGCLFSPQKLEKDLTQIREYYYDRGYLYIRVIPTTQVNEGKCEVNIDFSMKKGVPVYIDGIEFTGNIKTKDRVLRRELTIFPGERFDLTKLRRSRQKIANLGVRTPYFEKVGFNITGAEKEKKSIIFTVEEGKTTNVLFGGGYSSIDKLVGFAEINIDNFDMGNAPTFTGGGQSLALKLESGAEKENYRLSFTEPWFFDHHLLFGLDAYKNSREWSDYDEKRVGGRVRAGFSFREYYKTRLTYKYEDVDIFNIEEGASEELGEEEGIFTTSSLSTELIRDTRDNVFNPSTGARTSIFFEVAGGWLKGDRDFTKCVVRESWFYPLRKNLTLNIRLRGGAANEFGDSSRIPIYERFYLGGINSIRGYGYRDIGPKDALENPIGGKIMALGNIELIFPLVEKLKGAVFYDIGNVWAESADFDLGDTYSGIGVGIRVASPIGPLRFDYGYGLEIHKGRLDFSMGWSF